MNTRLTNFNISRKGFIILIAAVILGGCQDTFTDDPRSENDPYGYFTLHIQNTPAMGTDEVVMTIARIRLNHISGEVVSIDVNPPMRFELLSGEQYRRVTLFEEVRIPSGIYNSVNVETVAGIENSYVKKTDGTTVELITQNLQINEPFRMDGAFISEYLIDLNLPRALVDDGNTMRLRPVLHVLKIDGEYSSIESVHIVGAVGIPYTLSCESYKTFLGYVYVFQGDVTPDDMDLVAGSVEPYSVVAVEVDGVSAENFYEFVHLPPGDYTISYSCDIDDPEVDDPHVRFAGTQLISLPKPGGSKHVHFIER